VIFTWAGPSHKKQEVTRRYTGPQTVCIQSNRIWDLELGIVGRHSRSSLSKTVVREMAIYRSGLAQYRSSAIGNATVHGWMTGLDFRQ
jgi:hypothetical protein